MTKPHSTNHPLAVFSLLFGALCWGIIWFPYRIMAEAGVAGVASSFYTYGIILILAGAYFAKHWRDIFSQPLSILWLCVVAGWTNLAYVLAVIDGEVMRVMLLFYLSPLWTLMLAHFWLKERTNARGLMIIALSLLGAFIMLNDFTGQSGAWPLP
ncbi:MAG TPA: EamA family transporter, partial [Methylotenera sp.]|nr:EamA family transporter [Methylotenera sp.]